MDLNVCPVCGYPTPVNLFSQVASRQVRLRSLPRGGRGTGRTDYRCPAGMAGTAEGTGCRP